MTTRSLWKDLRDWTAVACAFAMVLTMTFAPSLLRGEAPPSGRIVVDRRLEKPAAIVIAALPRPVSGAAGR